MKKALKILGWIAAALVAIVLWFAFPDIQPIVTWFIAAAFIYHMVSTLVEETTRRVIRDELQKLREHSYTNTERLEAVDRKVSALLRDALEQRRARH